MKKTAIALATTPAMAASSAAADTRILVYGDSLTWGWAPVKEGFPSTRLSDDQRWGGVLEKTLGKVGKATTVIVDGLPNRTIATPYSEPQNGIPGAAFAASQDLRAAVAGALPLDLVVIMLGTNDARSDIATAPKEAADAMAALVEDVRTINGGQGLTYPAPRVLVVAPPTVGDTSATPLSGITEGSTQRSIEIVNAIVDAGSQKGFDVFNANDAVSVDGIDGLHLTIKGHALLGEAVAERVQAVLPKE